MAYNPYDAYVRQLPSSAVDAAPYYPGNDDKDPYPTRDDKKIYVDDNSNNNNNDAMWYSKNYTYYSDIADATKHDRQRFIVKVYSILTAQLFATFLIAFTMKVLISPQSIVDNPSIFWTIYGTALFGLIVLLIMGCACSDSIRRAPGSVIYLSSFTSCVSAIVGLTFIFYPVEIIVPAIFITGLLVLGLTLYAIFTPHDLTGAGPYLFAGLLVIILCSIFMSCFRGWLGEISWLNGTITVLSILLFSMFLVYDTQMIVGETAGTQRKHQYSTDDYVFAALNIYLDVVNLLLLIIQALGEAN